MFKHLREDISQHYSTRPCCAGIHIDVITCYPGLQAIVDAYFGLIGWTHGLKWLAFYRAFGTLLYRH